MTTGNGIERTLGKLLQSHEDMAKDIESLTKDVRKLTAHMERQKGGWKAIAVAAGTIGGLAGFLARYIPH